MSAIRMFCIDLDGTLLTDEKTVSDANRKALREAHEAGVEIVIATGRQYRKAKAFANEVDVPVVIIANNGTVIRDPRNDQRLYSNPMPKELAEHVVRLAEDFGHAPIVHVDRYEEGTDIIITDRLPSYVRDSYGLAESPWVHQSSRIRTTDIERALSVVFFGKRGELDEFHEVLKRELSINHVSHFMYNLMKFEAMLEILGETGTKWDGIRLYAHRIGIEPEQIAVIGDDSNDLQMIQNAKLSFTPHNGIPLLKEVASVVLPQSNNEDAVAHAVARILAS